MACSLESRPAICCGRGIARRVISSKCCKHSSATSHTRAHTHRTVLSVGGWVRRCVCSIFFVLKGKTSHIILLVMRVRPLLISQRVLHMFYVCAYLYLTYRVLWLISLTKKFSSLCVIDSWCHQHSFIYNYRTLLHCKIKRETKSSPKKGKIIKLVKKEKFKRENWTPQHPK